MNYNKSLTRRCPNNVVLLIYLGETISYVLTNSTTFSVPNGTFRLRILALGGGGGGCGGIKQGRGESGDLVVNIIQISGPRTVNVSIGRGGLGERGHTADLNSEGVPSQFGDYVIAAGGHGCARNLKEYSLMEYRGIQFHRKVEITKGNDTNNNVNNDAI